MAKVKHTGISLKLGLGTVVVLTHLSGRDDASYVEGTASEKLSTSINPLNYLTLSIHLSVRYKLLTDRTTLLFLAMLFDLAQEG